MSSAVTIGKTLKGPFFFLSFFFKPLRYPNISCELLTSDVSQINDRLGEDEKLLMKLYSFLQNEPPLNPLLASFFSKVLSILIGRKPEQVGFLFINLFLFTNDANM